MLDTLAYVIGYMFLGVAALGMVAFVGIPFYWSLTATLDVLSQYYMLWREKRKPKEGVTFWEAWHSSFNWQEDIWGRIWYRIKRAHGLKAVHPVTGDEWKSGR